MMVGRARLHCLEERCVTMYCAWLPLFGLAGWLHMGHSAAVPLLPVLQPAIPEVTNTVNGYIMGTLDTHYIYYLRAILLTR